MSDPKAIVSEIEMDYRHYIEVFNREDAVGFVGCYTHPHTMMSGEQGLSVVNTAAEHERGYQALRELLRQQGWLRSDIDQMQVWPLSDTLAQLIADVTRIRKDGTVLEKLRASYMLRREQGGWKILAFNLVAEPYAGPGLPRPV